MYFKISNTAELKQIENETNTLCKYPNLYMPQVVVSGLTEVSIPIITMDDSRVISMAIWGMLPSNYQEDWELFQKHTNTLNIHINTLNTNLWYKESLVNKRCLIPVTGFFTSFLRNGVIQHHFISAKDAGILYLAGLYTRLDDGFITCSILTGPIDAYLKRYQNMLDFMPLTLGKELQHGWLSYSTSPNEALSILKLSDTDRLTENPIAKDLFDQDISYDSILYPNEHSDN